MEHVLSLSISEHQGSKVDLPKTYALGPAAKQKAIHLQLMNPIGATSRIELLFIFGQMLSTHLILCTPLFGLFLVHK